MGTNSHQEHPNCQTAILGSAGKLTRRVGPGIAGRVDAVAMSAIPAKPYAPSLSFECVNSPLENGRETVRGASKKQDPGVQSPGLCFRRFKARALPYARASSSLASAALASLALARKSTCLAMTSQP